MCSFTKLTWNYYLYLDQQDVSDDAVGIAVSVLVIFLIAKVLVNIIMAVNLIRKIQFSSFVHIVFIQVLNVESLRLSVISRLCSILS